MSFYSFYRSDRARHQNVMPGNPEWTRPADMNQQDRGILKKPAAQRRKQGREKEGKR
jgi:hypothetical protein